MMEKMDSILGNKDISSDMFFKYRLFLSNWYFLLRNWLYVRSSDGYFKTSVVSFRKIVTILMLYAFSKNFARVGFLGRISKMDMIILKLDLSRSSIF